MQNRNLEEFWVLAKFLSGMRPWRVRPEHNSGFHLLPLSMHSRTGEKMDLTFLTFLTRQSPMPLQFTEQITLSECYKLVTPQNPSKLRFCMMQICGPEALGLHSCKLRWDQNEDGMLRTFIPAGCGLRSVGPGKPCNRER